jgi:hypothetical protein
VPERNLRWWLKMFVMSSQEVCRQHQNSLSFSTKKICHSERSEESPHSGLCFVAALLLLLPLIEPKQPI